MNLTKALLSALKERGAREIFGIPGDFALPYFKIIEESGILPLYTLSHEPGVGFAADAAARFRGGLGVAAVTYGAGALNLVNAVAQAYAEKSPLVVISGAPGTAESNRGLLLHHQAKTLDSQFRIFQEVTCDQVVLDNPAIAPEAISRVLQSCLEYSRPVYIEIPRDMPLAECHPVPPPEPMPFDADAVAACADAVLEAIDSAETPALLAGVEIRRFGLEDKVEQLARTLGVPVATTFMGSGLLACYEDLAGVYLGAAGDPRVTKMIEGSDRLVMLGVILSDTNFGVSEKAIDMRHTVQMMDRQVRMGFHVYPDIPLAALIDAMLERLKGQAPTAGTPCVPEFPSGLPRDEQGLTPMDIATAVNDLLAEHRDVPLAVDIGDCMFTAMSVRHTPMVAPGYYASMGFGVPAGIGVQVTSGQRPIILVGDGAFLMTGWELGNCARLGLDPVVIVFNNASWEMLRTFQPGMSYHDLGEWRYAELAKAMGGDGYRANTRRELAEALNTAMTTRGRFQLVEAMLPQGCLSDTLSRFVASFAKKVMK